MICERETALTPHTNSARLKNTAQLIRTPLRGEKRTGLLSAVLVGALALTACGSDDVDANDTSSSSATSVTSAESSALESQTVAESAQETAEPISETAAAPEAAEQAPAAVAPSVEVDQDAVAIRALVMGLNNTETLREYMEYIPLHTCSRVVNSAGGWESFDFSSVDPELQAQLEASVENTHVDDVTNIVVNGTTATGDVTSTTAGAGTTSETMAFEYENNTWTFCQ